MTKESPLIINDLGPPYAWDVEAPDPTATHLIFTLLYSALIFTVALVSLDF